MVRVLGFNKRHEPIVQSTSLDGLNIAAFAWCWVDFCEPTPEEEQLLATQFQFHHLAVEDCLHRLQRPKMEHYDDVHFFVLHAIESSSAEPREINLFLAPKLLVTYHQQKSHELDEAWETMVQSTKHRSRGPVYAAYYVVDKLVDEYFPCVQQVTEQLEDIEMRENLDPSIDIMQDLFAIRSQLLKLRRTILPMRDLLYRMMNTQKIEGLKDQLHYFGDIHDHLIRLVDSIELNRDLTADLRDSYLSVNSYRMNTIMKTLTVFTTIFMPLTFIVGIYGMNFQNMPELHWKWGYFAIMGLIFLLVLGMLWWFRKKRWFT